jgi:DNA topoisomerase-1
VLEALNEKHALKGQAVERVVFNAITKQSVTEAMKHPRAIDGALVDAYLARRALDYLVGFTLSPVLWRKLPGARSAGRVQSVALRLVCDRELDIEKFIKKEYWSILAKLTTPRDESFEARVVGADGQKLQRLDIGSVVQADDLKNALEGATFSIAAVEAKPARRNPPPPFTTSTMQQEASRKLGFAPAIAMRLAQRLYEGVEIDGETTGLITYMRTDGIDMAPEAIGDIRAMIGKNYGKEYVPGSPRTYQNKSKNAQEAHEAVRPTNPSRTPADVAKFVDRDQARLYELIWNRAVASQMESAELERTTVDIAAKNGARTIDLRATGQVVKFDGFLTLYQEGEDETPDDEESRRLPAMSDNERLRKESIAASQHFTEPPPRFSEAALVKRMEELGIGRPSTYASVLQVLQDRGYVRLDKKRLIPEDKGRVVVGFLESFFARYVEYDFTASLEEQLDRISNNEIAWKKVLEDFWVGFIGAVNEIKDLRITQVLDALNDLLGPHIFPARDDGGDVRQCPQCGNGKLSLKVGRFGAFIGCSNYPDCTFTRQMTPGAGGQQPTKVLGVDPVTNLEVTLRGGRFGTYLQLGEEIKAPKRKKGEKKDPDAPKSEKILPEKPKRASLPKGVAAEDIDLDKALALLALPREVGISPEDGVPILAGVGRFGPYVKHGKIYASLEEGDDVLTVGLNRAMHLIADKIANPKKGRRFGADPGKALGEHPDKGGPIVVKNGRYGPYVSHNGINATLTGDKTPDTVTLDEAVVLLDARAAAVGNSPKGRRAAGRKKPSGKAVANPAGKPGTAARKPPAAANPAAKAKKPAAVAAKAKPARRTKAAE